MGHPFVSPPASAPASAPAHTGEFVTAYPYEHDIAAFNGAPLGRRTDPRWVVPGPIVSVATGADSTPVNPSSKPPGLMEGLTLFLFGAVCGATVLALSQPKPPGY